MACRLSLSDVSNAVDGGPLLLACLMVDASDDMQYTLRLDLLQTCLYNMSTTNKTSRVRALLYQ